MNKNINHFAVFFLANEYITGIQLFLWRCCHQIVSGDLILFKSQAVFSSPKFQSINPAFFDFTSSLRRGKTEIVIVLLSSGSSDFLPKSFLKYQEYMVC